MQVRFTWPQN